MAAGSRGVVVSPSLGSRPKNAIIKNFLEYVGYFQFFFAPYPAPTLKKPDEVSRSHSRCVIFGPKFINKAIRYFRLHHERERRYTRR